MGNREKLSDEVDDDAANVTAMMLIDGDENEMGCDATFCFGEFARILS